MPFSKEQVEEIISQLRIEEAISQLRIDSGRIWVYGEGGLLVYKRIFIPYKEHLGRTVGGSITELHLLNAKMTRQKEEDFELNNGETLCSLVRFDESSNYWYVYRQKRWHRPVLPSLFRAFKIQDQRGLYWYFTWMPNLLGRIPLAKPFDTKRPGLIWGFVPLNEISDVSRNIILANRCFVVGFVDNDGTPTDKDPSHYIRFSDVFPRPI